MLHLVDSLSIIGTNVSFGQAMTKTVSIIGFYLSGYFIVRNSWFSKNLLRDIPLFLSIKMSEKMKMQQKETRDQNSQTHRSSWHHTLGKVIK